MVADLPSASPLEEDPDLLADPVAELKSSIQFA